MIIALKLKAAKANKLLLKRQKPVNFAYHLKCHGYAAFFA